MFGDACSPRGDQAVLLESALRQDTTRILHLSPTYYSVFKDQRLSYAEPLILTPRVTMSRDTVSQEDLSSPRRPLAPTILPGEGR